MANGNNNSKILIWILIAVAVAAGLFWVISLLFPHVISKFTALLVSLLVVVSGAFLRRKK